MSGITPALFHFPYLLVYPLLLNRVHIALLDIPSFQRENSSFTCDASYLSLIHI